MEMAMTTTAAVPREAIIGHEAVLAYLDRARTGGRQAHAYLFVGPENVGKTTVAMRLAADLLGSERPDTHPDFVMLERERDPKTGKLHGEIVIGQVHALRGRLALGAMMNGWRVAVADGAHLLGKEAANALLKTLEEPHEKTMLALLAASEAQVMPTIRSRCQIVRFARVPTAAIAEALARRGAPPDKAELYARLSGGRPGRALAFADRPASLDAMFALRETILGLPDSPVAARWQAVGSILPPKLPFQESVDRVRETLDLAAELLRDAMLIAGGAEDAGVHVDVRGRLRDWAGRFGRTGAASRLAELQETRRLVDENVNPRAALEQFTLSF
jgi:DNA polymerase-3 subunit delta'